MTTAATRRAICRVGLGVLPGTDYDEESFALEHDSALVMTTDGVVEGRACPWMPDWSKLDGWSPGPSTTGWTSRRPRTASLTPLSRWTTRTMWRYWSSDVPTSEVARPVGW
ncbi:SpoIIE family protein phosphatase [Streptomyces mirabilis]|uniref:SpoIIE family protein phosphatase n=1 Tax=Streptomyces mirabilis TaxID=68239 RepID=UPI0036DF0931